MVVGVNFSEVVGALPEGAVKGIGTLVLILQAAGVAFIIYVIYLLFRAVLNIKRYNLLRSLDEKIDIIDDKLNKILAKDKKSDKGKTKSKKK